MRGAGLAVSERCGEASLFHPNTSGHMAGVNSEMVLVSGWSLRVSERGGDGTGVSGGEVLSEPARCAAFTAHTIPTHSTHLRCAGPGVVLWRRARSSAPSKVGRGSAFRQGSISGLRRGLGAELRARFEVQGFN